MTYGPVSARVETSPANPLFFFAILIARAPFKPDDIQKGITFCLKAVIIFAKAKKGQRHKI